MKLLHELVATAKYNRELTFDEGFYAQEVEEPNPYREDTIQYAAYEEGYALAAQWKQQF